MARFQRPIATWRSLGFHVGLNTFEARQVLATSSNPDQNPTPSPLEFPRRARWSPDLRTDDVNPEHVGLKLHEQVVRSGTAVHL